MKIFIVALVALTFYSCITEADLKRQPVPSVIDESIVKVDNSLANKVGDYYIQMDEINNQLKKLPTHTVLANANDDFSFLVKSWQLISLAADMKSDSIKKMSKILKATTTAYQKSLFPLCRKLFTKESNALLWKEDGGSKQEGSTKLILWGSMFLPNKTKEKTMSSMTSVLTKYRFQKLSFQWLQDDSKEVYYTLSNPKDAEPVLTE